MLWVLFDLVTTVTRVVVQQALVLVILVIRRFNLFHFVPLFPHELPAVVERLKLLLTKLTKRPLEHLNGFGHVNLIKQKIQIKKYCKYIHGPTTLIMWNLTFSIVSKAAFILSRVVEKWRIDSSQLLPRTILKQSSTTSRKAFMNSI